MRSDAYVFKMMTRVLVVAAMVGCRAHDTTSPDTQDRIAELEAASADAKRSRIAAEAQEERAVADHASATRALQEAETRNSDHETRRTSAAAEVDRYARFIAVANAAADECYLPIDDLIEIHHYLERFVAEPRRDEALARLERCRKPAYQERRGAYREEAAAAREAFARELETAFDEEYPALRGHLVATIKEDTLQVEIPGFHEWRARDSQDRVEAWCTGADGFSKISLRNAHGTFRCAALEPPRERLARRLHEDGLADPWVPVASGKLPTPDLDAAPPPVDAVQLAHLRARATATSHGVDAAEAAVKHASESVLHHNLEKRRLEAADETPARGFRYRGSLVSNQRPQGNGRGLLAISVVANLGGLVGVFSGLYGLASMEAITDGRLEFETAELRDAGRKKAMRLTLGSFGIALPLAVIGMVTAMAAGKRIRADNRVGLKGSGLLVKF